MIRIAIAGYGQLASAIVDALFSGGNHEVTVLSRQDTPPKDVDPRLYWIKVDYQDSSGLSLILRGVDTVLSFILVQNDVNSMSQKALIDACVMAGVKRFAPSEWAIFDISHYPFYNGKKVIRDYLKFLNRQGKVLEYTLFTPGMFLDYLGPAHKMVNGVTHSSTFLDFEHCRAILPEGSDAILSFTTVKDVGQVVAKAIDSELEWPVFGGICANRISLSEILEVGFRVRGRPFQVERPSKEQIGTGQVNTSWVPLLKHPSFTVEQQQAASQEFLAQTLAAVADGAWSVPDQWTGLLPDLHFTKIEPFLREVWDGEP